MLPSILGIAAMCRPAEVFEVPISPDGENYAITASAFIRQVFRVTTVRLTLEPPVRLYRATPGSGVLIF